jgi:hypothetical protein
MAGVKNKARERNDSQAVNRCGKFSTVLTGKATDLQDSLSPTRIAIMRAGVKLLCAHQNPQQVGRKPLS